MKTKAPKRRTAEEAETRGNQWLAKANEAAERGDHAKAERYYAKGQYWLDQYNIIAGNR